MIIRIVVFAITGVCSCIANYFLTFAVIGEFVLVTSMIERWHHLMIRPNASEVRWNAKPFSTRENTLAQLIR